MKKLLADLRETETKIYEFFGTTTSWLSISDMTDEFWAINAGSEVHWSDEEIHITEMGEGTYVEEIKHNGIWEGDGFTLVNLRLSTGDEGAYVFDNSKKRELP